MLSDLYKAGRRQVRAINAARRKAAQPSQKEVKPTDKATAAQQLRTTNSTAQHKETKGNE